MASHDHVQERSHHPSRVPASKDNGREGEWIDCNANVDIGLGDDGHDGMLDFVHPFAQIEHVKDAKKEIIHDENDILSPCYYCNVYTCPDDRCPGCQMMDD